MDFGWISALECFLIDCQLQNGLAHSLGKRDVVALAFDGVSSDRRTKANLELERFASEKGGRDRLQHIEWSPVTGQAFDEKWHDWSARFIRSNGRSGVPCLLHMRFEISIRGAYGENSQNRLFTFERFGIS